MAKRKAAAGKPKFWKEKGDHKPVKQCSACHVWHHPAFSVCPNCGHAYAPRKSRKTKQKRVAVAREAASPNGSLAQTVANLKTARQLIVEAGGIQNARLLLDAATGF